MWIFIFYRTWNFDICLISKYCVLKLNCMFNLCKINWGKKLGSLNYIYIGLWSIQ